MFITRFSTSDSNAPEARPDGNGGTGGAVVHIDEQHHRGLSELAKERESKEPRQPRSRRRRFRLGRWILRGLLVLLVLLVLAVIGIQIALGTSLPKSIVLSQIEQQLGLRAQASSVTTGWFGHTTLRDVKLSLPLAQQAALEVPEMRVQHTWLPLILLGWGVEIKAIELDNAKLYAWQEPGGRWNVSEILELVGRTGGKKQGQEQAQQATPTAPPKLPRLAINHATLSVTDLAHRSQTIRDVSVRGYPKDVLLYEYDATVADHVSLAGRLVPGGEWKHEVTAKVHDIQAWLRPWAPNAPDVSFAGEWRGQAGNGGASGRLRIDQLAVNANTVKGVVNLHDENGVFVVEPQALVIHTGNDGGSAPAAPANRAGDTAVASAADAYVWGVSHPTARPFDALAPYRPVMWVTTPGLPTARAAFDAPAAVQPIQEAQPATAPTTSPTSLPTTSPASPASPDSGLRLSVASGRITFDGKQAAAERLHVVGLGGNAEVNGQYTLGTSSGQLTAVWAGLTMPSGISQSGSLHATIGRRLDGGPEAHATLTTHGAVGAAGTTGGAGQSTTRSWDGQFQFAAAGPSWKDLRLTLTAPALRYAGTHPLAFDGLTVAAALRTDPGTAQTVLTLDTIRLPDQRRLIGSGSYNLTNKTWWLRLDGTGWPLPQVGNETLTFRVDTGGDAAAVAIKDLSLWVSDVNVKAHGSYTYAAPKPVDLTVNVNHREKREIVNVIDQVRQKQRGGRAGLVSGTLEGTATVQGTLVDPLDLDIRGKLAGHDLWLRNRPLGEVMADVAGKVDNKGDEPVAELHTNMLKLLGGTWDLQAAYLMDTEATTVQVKVRDLPIQEVAAAAGHDDLMGTVDGNWNIYTPGLSFAPAGMAVHGGVTVRNVKYGTEFSADTLTATTTLEKGRLVVPVEIRRGTPNGDAQGVIKLSLATQVNLPTHIDVTDLSLANWPVEAGGSDTMLYAAGGTKRIAIDLPNEQDPKEENRKLRVTSDVIDLTADMQLAGKPAGKVEVLTQLKGRTIDVPQITGDVLGSQLWGQSVIDFDHPLLAAGEVMISDVEAERVAALFPGLKALSGRIDVHARLAPARSPNALEPLQLDVDVNTQGTRYADSVTIGGAKFRAYLNVDPHWGLLRAVLEDEKFPAIPPAARPGQPPAPMARPPEPSVNTIQLADGVLKVWGRLVRYEDELGQEGATSFSTQVKLQFQSLQLDQLVHAGDKTAGAMPGFLNGGVVLYGSTAVRGPKTNKFAPDSARPVLAAGTTPTTQPDPNAAKAEEAHKDTLVERILYNLYGDGSVELQQANLANFGPISFLFGMMHLGQNMNTPTGTGRVNFRIEGNRMNITRLYYFNKGVEVRGTATVDELKKIPDSPLNANLVGSARPLKYLKFPVLEDIDQILGVLQTNAAAVSVGGTVHNPKIQPILLGSLGREMRELLMGDVKSQVQGSAQ